MRLNANGKRLDAWLIYKCTACDQTWNRPILDRHPVSRVSKANLEAMQQSAPDRVKAHEFDLAALRVHCSQIHHLPDVTIEKRTSGHLSADWDEISLLLRPKRPVGVRLDRLLCEGWHLSRSHLQTLTIAGAVVVHPAAKNALKKPLRADVTIRVLSKGLSTQMRETLIDGLVDKADS